MDFVGVDLVAVLVSGVDFVVDVLFVVNVQLHFGIVDHRLGFILSGRLTLIVALWHHLKLKHVHIIEIKFIPHFHEIMLFFQ